MARLVEVAPLGRSAFTQRVMARATNFRSSASHAVVMAPPTSERSLRQEGATRIVPILLYHTVSTDSSATMHPFSVSPETFKRQMDYIQREGYATLSVSQLVEAVRHGPHKLPDKVVCITFDDGFLNFYDVALPLLEERQLRATVYVTTGTIGRTRVQSRRRQQLEQMLGWPELEDISARGVEIGGHTHTHPQLDVLPRQRVREEVLRCKAVLEDHLGTPIRTFAYPHGYSNALVRRVVVESGYESACSVKNALSSTNDDRFAMARLTVKVTTPMDQLAGWLHGTGAPVTPRNDRLRTRCWRAARRVKEWKSRLKSEA